MRKLFPLSLLFVLTPIISSANKWIFFYSQGGIPGHAFVSFFEQDPKTKKPKETGSWGFHPIINYYPLSPTPGHVVDETYTFPEDQFISEVTDEEFQKCVKTKNEWIKKTYSFTSDNCIDFVRAMAENIKLLQQPPTSLNSPFLYVSLLKVMNKDWEQSSIRTLNFLRNQPVGTQVKKTVKLEDKNIDYGVSWLFRPAFIMNRKALDDPDYLTEVDKREVYMHMKLSYYSDYENDDYRRFKIPECKPSFEWQKKQSVNFTDLNNDGIYEMLIIFKADCSGGLEGDRSYIFQKIDGKFIEMLGVAGDATVSMVRTNGYMDIDVYDQAYISKTYKWTGTGYQFVPKK